jgi:hypothetical protein
LSKAELPTVVWQYSEFWAEFKVGFVLAKSVFNQSFISLIRHIAKL